MVPDSRGHDIEHGQFVLIRLEGAFFNAYAKTRNIPHSNI